MNTIENLFQNYGYWVLLIGLFLEFIMLPFPGEVTMSYCGYLVYQHKMDWGLSIFVAAFGAILGITTSYIIGYRLGYPFFYKYGKYFHLSKERLEHHALWFDKFGKRIIFFAYFFPGLRHVTGYFSGITRLSYRKFSKNAYFGALFWVLTFITAGAGLGPKWDKLHTSLKNLGVIGGIALFIIVIAYYLINYYRNTIITKTIYVLKRLMVIFHTLGRMKVAITLIAGAFLVLTAGMVEIVQDFISNENTKFDVISSYYVKKIYTASWNFPFKVIVGLVSQYCISALLILGVVIVLMKSKEKFLEIRALLVTFVGGKILIHLLNEIFYKLNPSASRFTAGGGYSYPSPEVMMGVISYGFIFFLLYKYNERYLIKVILTIIMLGIVVLLGQGVLFLGPQQPSDVLSGYIFGGIWLSLNIVLMEIYRILPQLKANYNSHIKK